MPGILAHEGWSNDGQKMVLQNGRQELHIHGVASLIGEDGASETARREQGKCGNKVHACAMPDCLQGLPVVKFESWFVEVRVFSSDENVLAGIAEVAVTRQPPAQQMCQSPFLCRAVGSGVSSRFEVGWRESDLKTLVSDGGGEVNGDI